jgi:cytochrome c
MRVKILAATAMLIGVGAGTASGQDAASGANVFHQCQICHSIGPDAQNKIGPELNGLDGRHSGAVANYSYSDATRIRESSETKRRSRNTS